MQFTSIDGVKGAKGRMFVCFTRETRTSNNILLAEINIEWMVEDILVSWAESFVYFVQTNRVLVCHLQNLFLVWML